MNTKCRYTALIRARDPDQVSFSNVKIAKEVSSIDTNISNKVQGHKRYDAESSHVQHHETNLSVKKVKTLFEKQSGECLVCGCMMKTCGYKQNDKVQFSIDRIDSRKGHTEDNIQLLCWGCNHAKQNRFFKNMMYGLKLKGDNCFCELCVHFAEHSGLTKRVGNLYQYFLPFW